LGQKIGSPERRLELNHKIIADLDFKLVKMGRTLPKKEEEEKKEDPGFAVRYGEPTDLVSSDEEDFVPEKSTSSKSFTKIYNLTPSSKEKKGHKSKFSFSGSIFGPLLHEEPEIETRFKPTNKMATLNQLELIQYLLPIPQMENTLNEFWKTIKQLWHKYEFDTEQITAILFNYFPRRDETFEISHRRTRSQYLAAQRARYDA
jgi:hypothetical protein